MPAASTCVIARSSVYSARGPSPPTCSARSDFLPSPRSDACRIEDSVSAERDAGDPAGEQRHHGGRQPVEQAVLARRIDDELLEADLDDLKSRIRMRDQIAVGEQ